MQREQLVAGKCLYNLKTGENYKILYLDWPENIIYAVELGKTIAYPVALAAGKILESDMEVRDDEIEVRDVSTASPKQREELESRWALIRAFVLDEPACYQKKVRSTFAAETAKGKNVRYIVSIRCYIAIGPAVKEKRRCCPT